MSTSTHPSVLHQNPSGKQRTPCASSWWISTGATSTSTLPSVVHQNPSGKQRTACPGSWWRNIWPMSTSTLPSLVHQNPSGKQRTACLCCRRIPGQHPPKYIHQHQHTSGKHRDSLSQFLMEKHQDDVFQCLQIMITKIFWVNSWRDNMSKINVL